MNGFVDIHAHVLPGIDDGPADAEGALEMLRAAAASGITTIAATPHLRSDFPAVHVHELAERCEAVREAARREGIEIELVCAAEVSVSWALVASDEELRLASYAQRGRDLLIETPTTNVLGLDRILYELRLKGYRITLAHPERNPEFRRDISLLEALVDQGILLQINAESLLAPGSRFGPRRFSRELCRQGLAHLIASDGHRAGRWRPVTIFAEAVRAATDVAGAERAAWMTRAAGIAIVGGTEPPTPPEPMPPRRWWRPGRA